MSLDSSPRTAALTQAFDPLMEEKPDHFEVDLIPLIAKKLLESSAPDIKGVNKVYQSSIAYGLTSKQAIFESLGREILDRLNSTKVNPDPESARCFLNFILTCDPEMATGKPIPWVHAKKRANEPAQQPA